MTIRCNATIAILMATYNGGKYLGCQLDSLLAQTCEDWHLYIHDDGSTDYTLAVIHDYMEKHPDRITLLDYPRQGGPCRNFLSMLERVEADYYMFCDQDDEWLPEKIELSLQEMTAREKETPGAGIVVCSDLTVVDETMQVINPSMWDYLSIYPQYIKNFRDSGASAIVTGCTMFFNHQSKNDCRPFSPVVMMHDCWLCLCTLQQHGKLYGIPRHLVRYRQHGSNSMGVGVSSSQINLSYRIRHFRELFEYNVRYYRMLAALDYGSVFKYLAAKIRYRLRIKQGYY